jgi:hypothetical protein
LQASQDLTIENLLRLQKENSLMKLNACKLEEILRNERQQNFDSGQQALFSMNSKANGEKMGKIIESLQAEN